MVERTRSSGAAESGTRSYKISGRRVSSAQRRQPELADIFARTHHHVAGPCG